MKYVCTGATLKCTMGTSCPKLIATPKNVSLTGKEQANVADYVSMKNVPSFGRCRSLGYPPTASATAANHGTLTPMPCVPGTCPKWQTVDKDSLICGEAALLEPATLRCVYGGIISIVNPGQSLEIKVRSASFSQKSEMQQEEAVQEIPEELLQEFNALDRERLTQQSVLDGVQMALDVAGMVPGVGAAPDLLNAAISVMRGDWLGAGLSVVAAVPGVGDVVGGAKIAYRGATIAGKTSATFAKTGKTAVKNHSNVVSIGSYRKSTNKTTNIDTTTDLTESNVIHHSFDEFSKKKAKKRQVEVRKIANSKYSTSTKTTITSSIGSSSSSSTGIYKANPGNVVQEVLNAPTSGSSTSKQYLFNSNAKEAEVTKVDKDRNNGEALYGKDPNSVEEKIKKVEEQIKEINSEGNDVTTGIRLNVDI